MEEIEIPQYFLCPISLEIMKDPVTAWTGITYDRQNIERWIFTSKKKTCPVTKQPLPQSDITPNHTLRRLIQSWCIANASSGVERIPTPKPPIDKTLIIELLIEAENPQLQMQSLQRLKQIASESDRNKRCMETAGAADFLTSIIKSNSVSTEARDEALSLLHHLQLSEEGLRAVTTKNEDFVQMLAQVLQHGNCQSRSYATFLFQSIFEVLDPVHLIGLRGDIFHEIVRVLRDQISQQVTKSALKILVEICPWGRNRVKVSEAGAVAVLIELLLETKEKRISEMLLVVLSQLCGCADGRAELIKHRAGIAIVSKKILRVSQVSTEKAVRILYSVATFSATPCVLQEMLQVGAVAKLCFLLQVECGSKTKEKVKEILLVHSRAWKNSTCIPLHLRCLFPSH